MFPVLAYRPIRRVSTPTDRVVDNYTDTDLTLLSSHVPDTRPGTNAWSFLAGQFEILTNRASPVGAGTDTRVAIIDSGVADCTITVNSNMGTGPATCGIVFRATNTLNYWTVLANITTWDLYEVTSGSTTLRAQAANVFAKNTTYALAVVLAGDSITCTVDGGSSITYSSSVRSTVKSHGIRTNGFGSWFDAFKVTA